MLLISWFVHPVSLWRSAVSIVMLEKLHNTQPDTHIFKKLKYIYLMLWRVRTMCCYRIIPLKFVKMLFIYTKLWKLWRSHELMLKITQNVTRQCQYHHLNTIEMEVSFVESRVISCLESALIRLLFISAFYIRVMLICYGFRVINTGITSIWYWCTKYLNQLKRHSGGEHEWKYLDIYQNIISIISNLQTALIKHGPKFRVVGSRWLSHGRKQHKINQEKVQNNLQIILVDNI